MNVEPDNDSEVWTIYGLMPKAELTFSTGEVENENEHTTWEEWRDCKGTIVKRGVHVRLKRGVEIAARLGRLG